MMKMTCAEAAKLLRRLNENLGVLLAEERGCQTFVAALQEDVESVRPAYDFPAMQEKLAVVEAQIRAVRHAINVFNATHELPGFGMTIDAALVYLPQLTERKNKLEKMSKKLEKRRAPRDYGGASNLIEYEYANYSIEEARARYAEASDTLSRLQMAIDRANSEGMLEIDIDL